MLELRSLSERVTLQPAAYLEPFPGALLKTLDGGVARKLSTGRLTVEFEKSLVEDLADVTPEGARDVLVRHERRVVLVVVREDGEQCARSAPVGTG